MISVASSIKFRQYASGTLASFDATFHDEETFQNAALIPYKQKFLATDTSVPIQVKVDNGYTINMYSSEGDGGAWTAMTGETLQVNGSVYDYYETVISFASFTTVRFKVDIMNGVTISETWISEPCEVVENSDELLKIEFFSYDNCFEVDYSTEISHIIRVESELKEYRAGGETSVFDNQNEVTKIKAEVKRILVFKTEPIPRYLAEMLVVAMAHDKFFINEVEFVAESNPEIDNNLSNLVTLSCSLTQRSVVGLNTHDIGFDCDSVTSSDMIVLQELAASGQKSFAVTDDYMVLTITGEWVANTPIITAGTTPGGTEILSGMSLTSLYTVEVAMVPVDKASMPDGILYVTVSGSGAQANVYVATIKNRQ